MSDRIFEPQLLDPVRERVDNSSVTGTENGGRDMFRP